jgi:hypothetical protein
MGRGAFAADACRLLSLETLRLARRGAGARARRPLLRAFAAALAAERAPLRAWGAAARAARAARASADAPGGEPAAAAGRVAAASPAGGGGAERGLAAYDGDGARPLPAKAIVAQVRRPARQDTPPCRCARVGMGRW